MIVVDLFLGRCFRAAALWLAWRPALTSATDKEASERCRPSALSSRGSSKLMTCGIRAVRRTRPPAVGIQPSCYREKTVSHRVTTVSDCGRQQGGRVCWTADVDSNRAAAFARRRSRTATGQPCLLDGGRGQQQGGRVCSTADVDSNRAAVCAGRRTWTATGRPRLLDGGRSQATFADRPNWPATCRRRPRRPGSSI